MSRVVRPLRALLTAFVLIGSASLSGCASGPKLEKIEAPAEGIRLHYDLSPGLSFVGKVHRSETVRAAYSGQSQTRSLSFKVALTVRGPDQERGGTLVVARFSEVDLSWSLPGGLPFSLTDFTNSATAAIQGMEIDIVVAPDGKILHIPAVPPGASPELATVIQKVIEALETAFVTVPERPLKIGESWTDEKKRGREGKLGLYSKGSVTTKVDGYFRAESGDEVARLVLSEAETSVTTTKEGSHESKREGKSTTIFSVTGAYLVSTQGESTEFDPGNATTFSKIKVEWTKQGTAGAPSAPQEIQAIDDPCHPDYVGGEDCAPAGEVQTITDPCDPDYVGGEDCVPAAEGAEASEAPAAPPSEAAAGG